MAVARDHWQHAAQLHASGDFAGEAAAVSDSCCDRCSAGGTSSSSSAAAGRGWPRGVAGRDVKSSSCSSAAARLLVAPGRAAPRARLPCARSWRRFTSGLRCAGTVSSRRRCSQQETLHGALSSWESHFFWGGGGRRRSPAQGVLVPHHGWVAVWLRIESIRLRLRSRLGQNLIGSTHNPQKAHLDKATAPNTHQRKKIPLRSPAVCRAAMRGGRASVSFDAEVPGWWRHSGWAQSPFGPFSDGCGRNRRPPTSRGCPASR